MIKEKEQNPKELPQVEKAMLALTNTINELSTAILEVEGRLDTILKHDTRTEKEKQEEVELVPLAESLRNNTRIAQRVLGMCHRILSDLEL